MDHRTHNSPFIVAAAATSELGWWVAGSEPTVGLDAWALKGKREHSWI